MRHSDSSSFASLQLAILYRFDSMIKSVQYSGVLKNLEPLFAEFLFEYPDISFQAVEIAYKEFSNRKPFNADRMRRIGQIESLIEKRSERGVLQDDALLQTLNNEINNLLIQEFGSNNKDIPTVWGILESIKKENKILVSLMNHLLSLKFLNFIRRKMNNKEITPDQWKGLLFVAFIILNSTVQYLMFSNMNFLDIKPSDKREYFSNNIFLQFNNQILSIQEMMPLNERNIVGNEQKIFTMLTVVHSSVTILVKQEFETEGKMKKTKNVEFEPIVA